MNIRNKLQRFEMNLYHKYITWRLNGLKAEKEAMQKRIGRDVDRGKVYSKGRQAAMDAHYISNDLLIIYTERDLEGVVARLATMQNAN